MDKVHYTTTVAGQPHEIKMTFGLLNELVRLIGDPDSIGMISTDPDLQEAVLVCLLCKRDAKGIILERPSLFELDLAPDDAMDLLQWVAESVTDFFLKSATRTRKMVDERKGLITSLTSTPNGGQA